MRKLLLIILFLFLTLSLSAQSLNDYTFGQEESNLFYKQSKEFIIYYPILPIDLRPEIKIPKKEPLYYECDIETYLWIQTLSLSLKLEIFDKPIKIRRLHSVYRIDTE